MKCEVWSVKRAVRSVKCEVENRCTHGLGWSTAHASSIDEKGLIYIYTYIPKATSAPPRVGDYLWKCGRYVAAYPERTWINMVVYPMLPCLGWDGAVALVKMSTR